MKKLNQTVLIVLVLLFLSACGGVPTDGLTASVGTNQDQTETAAVDSASPYLQQSVTQCSGVWDADSNTVRISFQMETSEPVFGTTSAEDLFLFGSGTRLLGEAAGNPAGNVRFRCEGAAEMAYVPLQVGGETIGWLGEIVAPQLSVDLPSGAQTVNEIGFHGMLATSPQDLSIMFETIYGGNVNGNLQSFNTMQKALYQNHPDPAFVRSQAMNAGVSQESANRLGQLYGEIDEATQQQLLLDVMTSPQDEAYAEAAVSATVKMLAAMGTQPDEIAAVFKEETNGRIIVDLSNITADSLSNANLQVTERDGANSIVLTALPPGATGSSEDGLAAKVSILGKLAAQDDSDSDDSSGNDKGGDTGGGSDTGNDGGDGNNTGGGTDGGGTDGGGGGSIWDLFWNMFQGAAAGATLGALAGPEGALPGAEIGAAAGAYNWYRGGSVWDPEPDNPDSPCKSPLLNC